MDTKGKRLRAVRKSMGLEQKEMAAELSVQQGSYSKMENDKLGISEEAIIGLAKHGVNIAWLFTGDGDMFAKEPESTDSGIDEPLMKELEERVRRIKLDASDIEDTFKKILGRKR